MFSWILLFISATLGFLIGRLLARHLTLKYRMCFAFCVAGFAVILYLLCSWLLSISADPTNTDKPEENTTASVTPAVAKIPKPIIDIGLQPLPLSISQFRDQYNQIVKSRYPALATDIRIPALSIEKGLINDVLRYKNRLGIILSISAQKHSYQIDEITWMTPDHPQVGSIEQIQAMITAAVYTVSNASHIIEPDISALFIEVMVTPDILAERYVDDLQISVMLNASGNIIARLSRPAALPGSSNFFLHEEDY